MPGAWFIESDLLKRQPDLKGQSSKHILERKRAKGRKNDHLAVGW